MTYGSRSLSRSLILISAMGLALPAAVQAANIGWTGTATEGDGSSWDDALNWTNTDTSTVGTIPTSSDVVKLNGATVHITTAATISQWGNAGGSAQIDDGGSLTGAAAYTMRYVPITVNDGGTFAVNPAWGPARTSITVNEGGTLTGLSGMGTSNDSNTLTVNGNVSVGDTSSTALSFLLGNQVDSTGNRFGKLILNDTGEINFDVFDNNVNEFISVGFEAGTLLDLDAGTINLKPQGYTPKVGDTFDLWNTVADSVATVTAGDGSNIVLDGYELDTSTFATDGVVTVSAVSVPEPASLACVALGGVLLLRPRGRRGRGA